MLKFIPGNTYVVALLIQTQPDPTLPPTPAAGLTLTAYMTDTPNGPPVVSAASVGEVGAWTLADGTIAQKYLATFRGADTLTPLGTRLGAQMYVYAHSGTDLLEPVLALIEASEPDRT